MYRLFAILFLLMICQSCRDFNKSDCTYSSEKQKRYVDRIFDQSEYLLESNLIAANNYNFIVRLAFKNSNISHYVISLLRVDSGYNLETIQYINPKYFEGRTSTTIDQKIISQLQVDSILNSIELLRCTEFELESNPVICINKKYLLFKNGDDKLAWSWRRGPQYFKPGTPKKEVENIKVACRIEAMMLRMSEVVERRLFIIKELRKSNNDSTAYSIFPPIGNFLTMRLELTYKNERISGNLDGIHEIKIPTQDTINFVDNLHAVEVMADNTRRIIVEKIVQFEEK